MTGQEAKLMNDMTNAVEKDLTSNPVGKESATVSSINQGRERIIRGGEYAGKPVSAATSEQIEKNRNSVRAQRNNRIADAEKKIAHIDTVIERLEAQHEVATSDINGYYREVTDETRRLISETQKQLMLLNDRLAEEGNKQINELAFIENDYMEKRTDLEAMKAAESSLLDILVGKPEPKVTQQDKEYLDVLNILADKGMEIPKSTQEKYGFNRFGVHPLDTVSTDVKESAMIFKKNPDGTLTDPDGNIYEVIAK